MPRRDAPADFRYDAWLGKPFDLLNLFSWSSMRSRAHVAHLRRSVANARLREGCIACATVIPAIESLSLLTTIPYARLPPSTGSAMPVMKDAASEQSQTAARATSSAVPSRPIG